MNDDELNDDKALFAEYRATRVIAKSVALAVDPLLLASWIDQRLDAVEIEKIDELLASDSSLLDDILSAAQPLTPEIISSELLAKLMAFVPAKLEATPIDSAVIPFRPRKFSLANRTGTWLSWGAIAASLLVVSVAGLGVGFTAGQSLSDPGDSSRYSLSETLDSTSWMSDEVG